MKREKAVMQALVAAGHDTQETLTQRMMAAAILRAGHLALPHGAVVAQVLGHGDGLSAEAAMVEVRRGAKSAERIVLEVGGPLMDGATTWAALHEALAAEGIEYRTKGSGAVITIGDQVVKASTYRKAALNALTKRLGPFEERPPGVVVIARASEPAPGVTPETMVAIAAAREAATLPDDLAPLAYAPKLARAVAKLRGTPVDPPADARTVARATGQPLPVLAPVRRPTAPAHDPVSPLGRYHAAVGADAYHILVHQKATRSRDERVIEIPPASIDQAAARWPEVEQLMQEGGDAHIMPGSSTMHYVVLRGLDAEALQRMVRDGHEPALVVDNGAGRHDALLLAPRAPEDAPREDDAAAEATLQLTAQYGQKPPWGPSTMTRIPGTPAWKRGPSGSSGQAFILVNATQVRPRHHCPTLHALIRRLARQLRAILARYRDRDAAAGLTPYDAHRRDVLREMRGRRVDGSRVDALVAQRLRATGHTRGQVARTILREAPDALPGRRQADWGDYAARAAAYAFGPASTRALERDADQFERWRRLERTAPATTPMVEAIGIDDLAEAQKGRGPAKRSEPNEAVKPSKVPGGRRAREPDRGI